MIRRVLRHLIGDAPADTGPAPVLDTSELVVRECRADDLAVLTELDLWALRCALDIAPSRPHESTAAERTGGAA